MSHVIIVGPGRVGGTLMMQVLTELGLDTGFSKDRENLPTFSGGCRYEWPLRGSRTRRPIPYIIKEPQMCTDIDERIRALNIEVDHIYILLRYPGPVAPAIDFCLKTSNGQMSLKEEWCDFKIEKMIRRITKRILQLTHLVADMSISHTLISYPRWAKESEYLYNKLNFLMSSNNISQTQLRNSLNKFVDVEELKRVEEIMPDFDRMEMGETYD